LSNDPDVKKANSFTDNRWMYIRWCLSLFIGPKPGASWSWCCWR